MESILIYIDKNGNDNGLGTAQSPLQTLDAAHRMALDLIKLTPAPIELRMNPEDYGMLGSISMDTSGMRNIPEKAKETVNEYLPGIICWGDSLTAGGYPDILTQLLECNVAAGIQAVNRGVGGETSATIVGRSGAIPFVTSKEFTIPAKSTSYVEITFTLQDGMAVAPLRQGNCGMETVSIDGIEGVLSIDQESAVSTEYTYYFRRSEPGEAHTVSVGTEIITKATSEYLDYIPIIFIGQNGGYSTFDRLISQQRAIINRQTGHNERFIIVGLHTGNTENRSEMEAALEAEYGAQFLNLREYMSTVAIYEAGITPTEEDYLMMLEGSTPQSLLRDNCHFTPVGNELLAKAIFHRMDELGYFNEVREVLEK